MCGGFFSMAARAEAGVSPVRSSARTSWAASASARISASGTSRFVWMSAASAFNGET